jgi:hypothetical protein
VGRSRITLDVGQGKQAMTKSDEAPGLLLWIMGMMALFPLVAVLIRIPCKPKMTG